MRYVMCVYGELCVCVCVCNVCLWGNVCVLCVCGDLYIHCVVKSCLVFGPRPSYDLPSGCHGSGVSPGLQERRQLCGSGNLQLSRRLGGRSLPHG